MSSLITQRLITFARDEFRLDWDGIHGAPHWSRVRHNGLLLAKHAGHSDGHTLADVTAMTCWDADRLDLGRVGIRPHPQRLCNEMARHPEFISTAYLRSLQ